MLHDMKDEISHWDEGPAAGTMAVVRDSTLADLLTNPAVLRQLEPFLGRESSISQAARLTGIKPNTMLARVRRWEKLGLLKVVESVRRAGRPVRKYRTTADAWFIPFDTTSAESLEAGLAQRDSYWENRLRRAVVTAREQQVGTWGTRVYRDPRGRLQFQMAVSPERNWTSLSAEQPAVLAAWRDGLYLDFEDAKELQRELFELLLRYQRKNGVQRYLLRLGLAPLSE